MEAHIKDQNPFDVFSVDKYGHFHAWELKQTQTDSIPFSAVVDHQVTALEIVSGMVVIKYPKGVSIIPIDIFVDEKKRSDRKSLRWERAKELSTLTFDSKIRKE
jgi:penicillin-binding protein-related factor A (putative recombinase)